MGSYSRVEDLVAERSRLIAEADRIKERVAALSEEIDAHLGHLHAPGDIDPRMQLQQQQLQQQPAAQSEVRTAGPGRAGDGA